jgi:hypothetical protein
LLNNGQIVFTVLYKIEEKLQLKGIDDLAKQLYITAKSAEIVAKAREKSVEAARKMAGKTVEV